MKLLPLGEEEIKNKNEFINWQDNSYNSNPVPVLLVSASSVCSALSHRSFGVHLFSNCLYIFLTFLWHPYLFLSSSCSHLSLLIFAIIFFTFQSPVPYFSLLFILFLTEAMLPC